MKFSTSIKKLSEAVSHATLVLPAKAADPRFDSIALTLENNTLTVFASDGEFSLSRRLTVEGDGNGAIALPSRRFNEAVSNLYDAQADFKAEQKEAEGTMSFSIKTNLGSYKVAGGSEKTEKEDIIKSNDLEIKLDVLQLKDIADKTLFAVSTDSMRPSMTGVLFELEPKMLRAVATDGQRLVRATKKFDTGAKEKTKVIIPHRVLSVAARVLPGEGEVVLTFDLKVQRISFECGDVRLIASLIAENYPNYEAVIPLENDKRLVIKRQEMFQTVRRVGRYSDRRDVRLQVSENTIKVSAENQNEGSFAEETLLCEYKNDGMLIGFKSDLIADALDHLETEDVVFEFSSPTRATIVKPKHDETKEKKPEDILMLVMPYRLNN
ncbi:MAG: DNA polymerase III subunit beta [Chloroherpetonaceae bacterium]|nr:DNA polymerase III subunit beta [Chloroherpetonaceae bacterium]